MTEYIPLRKILPATSIGIVLTAMDSSIVNVSLKTIRDYFDTTQVAVSWVIVAYLLTISALIGAGGSVGDIFGRKRTFQFGMVVFGVGSVLCGLAWSLPVLVIARIIQAVGGAAIQANGLAIVITYIDPKVRGRAIGINSVVVSISLATGPVVGGVLTEFFGWQSIFLVNIPVAILGIVVVQFIIKETTQNSGVTMDFQGIALFTFAAFGLIAGLNFAFEGSILGILLLGASLLSGVLFYIQETRHPSPMIPVKIFQDRQISMGILSAIMAFMSINALIFLTPFYLQDVLKLTQSQTGYVMAIIPLSLAIAGPPAGLLAEKLPARVQGSIGTGLQALMSLGIAWYLITTEEINLIVFALLVALSAGFLALFTNANGTSVMNAAPKNNISVVSGLLNLSRNIAFTISTSIASLIFAFFQNRADTALSFDRSYTQSFGYTLLIFVTLNMFAVVFSLLRGKERVVNY